ncbi:MAG: GNAT family N-acetyltransferase [Alphaproteobacteria bacterium]|jgi:ribosomal-protein-alanine N-acetyltransferase
MAVKILTSRLLLRRFTQTDLPALPEMFADTAVQEYLAIGLMGPKGARAFAETFIRASDDEWREGGCGVMAMVPRGGGDGAPDDPPNAPLVGYCGLRHLPDRISAVEVVYALRQDRWGQGLATEAARAVLDWGFETLPVREILAFTRPPHAASRRVMEKAGMEFQGETDRYYGEILAVYGLSRPGNPMASR